MMKKNINDKYRVLLDSERLPFEVDKEKTDQVVSNLINALSQVCAEHRELDSNEFDGLSRMIRDYDSQADLYHFVLTLDALESLQADLKKEDVEVPAADDLKILSDEGFKQDRVDDNLWTKILEDTEEKEVVEEVYLGMKPIRRKRTILWDVTRHGKASRRIEYKDIPIDEHLKKLIHNTIIKLEDEEDMYYM